jgi:zinc/manganese transport system ATP-binding protein
VYAIELNRVTLARAGRTVLAQASARIHAGEFIGVFGPNGAGKTTLLRALLGLLRPAVGEIKVFGMPPTRGNRTVGYLPQYHAPVGELRLRTWDFVASAHHGERWGLPLISKIGKDDVDWAIETVGAQALMDRPVCALSGGEVQRVLLAQALLGKPRTLLLDEPLISLDPQFQQALVNLVKQMQRSQGMTVLFTAHDVNPLLGAMDRVLYLGHGRAALGTIEEVITDDVLSSLYGTRIEVLRVKDRILVVSGQGLVETDAHRHDV